jgi:bifunctional DNA-binding transcriptional regulator/antitoxin component of YhaV-PrlF toxin-antitoxin module
MECAIILDMEKNIIKLTKSSRYSYSVIIPKEIIEKYGWKAKQKLTIEDKGRGSLEIKDWRRK